MMSMTEEIKGNVLLGVTGSVAATVAHKLANTLMDHCFDIRVMATENSAYFTGWNTGKFEGQAFGQTFPVKVYSDHDEFSGKDYQKNQPIPHIDFGAWADLLLIAPADALTIGRMAQGLPDNLITATYLAWPRNKPIILAPAMNTRMWEHSAVQENIRTLRRRHKDHLMLVGPVAKTLACGETGIGAMADIVQITKLIDACLPWYDFS
jgi:phosphopantothenoylcysteine decarboxylase